MTACGGGGKAMGQQSRTLVIDCATEACSVALLGAAGAETGTFRMLGRGHAEHLIPMIAALPGRGRAERIAVALGPGSFTGVRVGLAAAKALGLAWSVPVLGYSTMELVAAMARDQLGANPAEPLAVVMTGGHGEWFVQEAASSDMGMSANLASLRPEQACAAVRCPLVAGTQSRALVERRGYGRAIEIWPDARRFALLPEHRLTPNLRPHYGRAPDARLPAGLA